MNSFIQSYQEKKFFLPAMAVLGGVILGLSWHFPFTFLIFIGLVPLLIIENHVYNNIAKRPYLKLFGLSFLYIFTWNITAYWWLWNASGVMTFSAWGANALLQTIPVMFFHLSKRASSNRFGYLLFVLYWIAFEYLHLHWDFSWPWLNLGNMFGFTPSWVQWYEYTGAFGGTLWVLLVNVCVYTILTKRRMIIRLALLLIIPFSTSFLISMNYEQKGEAIEIVAVQPNLDCYTEKFHYNAKTGERNQPTHVPYMKQIDRFIKLSDSAMTDKTQFIFWPETSLHKAFVEKKAENDIAVSQSIKFIQKHPETSLVTGIDSYNIYGNTMETVTARHSSQVGYYDLFNAALFINERQELEFYHKSQLVIGVETVPYPAIFRKIIMNFGGSSGGLGRQEEREVFFNRNNIGVAPIICYESVYGKYVTDYVKKGANFLTIITNDGWWNNTPGHKQHLAFASLRAIETRKDIARSANTGISCIVNQKGEIIKPLAYGKMGAVKGELYPNDIQTVYTKHGDYIAKILTFVAVFLFLSILVKRKVNISPLKK